MFLRPWYNKDANYQTNAKSFMDYLARTNKFLEVLIEDYETFQELVNEELETIKFDSEMAVDDILNQWLEDGTLARIINDGVLGNKVDQVDLDKTNEQLAQIGKNVKELGAVGDGNTDDTAAIQNAIDNFSRVFIPDGTYLINSSDNSSGLHIPSNIEIFFSPRAILKASGENTTAYRLMRINGVENVKIYNPVLLGDREYNSSTDGEHGYGIHIIHSKNVEVINSKTNDFWGDGLFIGETCENIVISNAISNNNRRQALSIVGGKNITINNSHFNNTEGTPPQAGVDIEPNSHNTILENLVFNDCVFEDNFFAGLLFYNIGQRFTATFNNCTIIGSPLSFRNNSFETNTEGSVVFNNLTSIDSPINAIRFEGNTFPVEINGLTIINPNRYGDPTNNGDAILIENNYGSNHNIKIKDIKLYNDRYIGNPVSIWTSSTVEGASVENVELEFSEINTNKVLDLQNNHHLNNLSIKIPYKKRLNRQGGNISDDRIRIEKLFYNIFTNENVDYSTEHTIGSHSRFEGHEIGLKVLSPHKIGFNFEGSALADGSTTISSQEVGAELIVRYEQDKWFIKKQIGTWTKT